MVSLLTDAKGLLNKGIQICFSNISNIPKKYLKMPCPSRDGRISDLKIFELWISVFALICFELRSELDQINMAWISSWTIYYRHLTNNPTEFQAHERLLLDLASKVLKRKICLISLFSDDKDEMFEPAVLNSSRTYYLLGCNRALYDNFYVSIFKKGWDHLNSSVTTFCLNFFSD